MNMELKECREEMRNCKAFDERITTLKMIFDNENTVYPYRSYILGFGYLEVNNRYELKGRIDELLNILNYKLEGE